MLRYKCFPDCYTDSIQFQSTNLCYRNWQVDYINIVHENAKDLEEQNIFEKEKKIERFTTVDFKGYQKVTAIKTVLFT